jgi:CRISPR-associated protein Csx1
MKFLFASWGYPYNWGYAHYSFKQKRLCSKTTLPILAKTIQPDRIDILGTDSVLGDHRIAQTYNKIKELETYSELINIAKKSFEEYIATSTVIEENEHQHNLKDLLNQYEVLYEVHILPNVGTYYKNFGGISFKGHPNDFKITLYWKLYKVLKEYTDKENYEFFIDLTHGLNYMPVIVQRVIFRIAELIRLVKSVSITSLNSEPYPLGYSCHNIKPYEECLKQCPNLEIFEIEKISLKKILGAKAYSAGESLQEVLNKLKDTIQLSEEDLKIVRETLVFLSAVLNGCPAVLYLYFPKLNELENIVERVFHQYKANTQINKTQQSIEVKRPFALPQILEPVIEAMTLARFMEALGFSRKDIVSIDDLYEALNKVFKETIKYEFIRKDISRIKNEYKKDTKGKVDKRNILAHSCLLWQHVVVTQRNRKGKPIKVTIKEISKEEIEKTLLEELGFKVT